MSPTYQHMVRTSTNQALINIEPAINAFTSMILVANEGCDPGLNEWTNRVNVQMSPEERFRHKLVTNGLYFAIIPQIPSTSFAEYLRNLDDTPPAGFVTALLNGYDSVYEKYKDMTPNLIQPDWNGALTSADRYVAQLIAIFGEEHTDPEIEIKAYQCVKDPPSLKKLVTDHIRWFWETYLQNEWNRVMPLVSESVNSFARLDLRKMSRPELFRFITDKEKEDPKWLTYISSVKKLVFVPNAHINPYIRTIIIQDTAYVVFGARVPEGSSVRIPELDRAEVAGKLAALSDETRLTILQLLAQRGEMRSTEIMEEIKLSQPSVSRYLAQLTASGYVVEKRINSAKAYAINKDRIEKTLQAISAFLIGPKI